MRHSLPARSIPGALLFCILAPLTAAAQGGQAPIAPPSPSAARAPLIQAAVVRSFEPTQRFDGTRLDGWRPLGGQWTARNGEFVGTTGPAEAAWLLLEQPQQDLAFTAEFRCAGECKAGILLRAETVGERTTGVLFSLAQGEMGITKVTLDGQGRILERSPANPPAAPAAPAAAPATPAPPAPVGLGNISAAQMGRPRPTGALRTDGGWNHLEVFVNGNTARAVLNGGGVAGGNIRAAVPSGFGKLGLHVGGAPGSEIHLRQVGVKNLDEEAIWPVEQISPRFQKRQLEALFYSEAIATADIDLDGDLDAVAGPYIYLGPDFNTRREIFVPQVFSPASYPDPLTIAIADVNGDRYPDVLQVGLPTRPGVLYINPGPVVRRWDRHEVIASVDSEVAFFEDMDGDGKVEFVYGDGGLVGYAKPGADVTQPWEFHPITEQGLWGATFAYGMGAGDINGDGRTDLVQTYGWWEQPANPGSTPWTYHPQAFGRWGFQQGAAGGVRQHVYDVNGDGLNDIVTSLEAHGFGLAWFEQKRSGGQISFERHMIMDDFAAPNNGVVFSIIHAVSLADVDGDGLQDIVTGKRWWGQFGENPNDPDSWGAPVLYWFRLTREGGQARYVPELIHNASGVGTQLSTDDVNRDGLPDVLTATRRGTFLFLSQRGAAAPAPR